jgi:peptidoglycan/xylan/chitin deacetylase (PgdA/CDA1 family)
MIPAVASLAKRCLLGSGHYARRLKHDRFPGVAVLCYHGVRPRDGARMDFAGLHVTVDELDAHCRLLRETCNPISLDDWRRALGGGRPLPPRPVLVTFDEGYATLLTEALPVVQRHDIPIVAFVWSDPVEQRSLAWYDAVVRARSEDEVERMKRLPYEEWRRRWTPHTIRATDTDPCAPLSPAQVRWLAAAPNVEIGGHTASHPILAQAAPEQQRDEIERNKSLLEGWVGRPVRAFAYPNGQPGDDYTPETVKLVEELGFDFAFTSRHGFAASSEPPLERSRLLMLAGISAAELAHRLSYSWRR